MPGPEVIHRWNPSGHRWLVYPGTGGAWERMPLTDYPNDYSSDINNAKTPWGKISDFLYPDPAACRSSRTATELAAGRAVQPGQCAWGYDFHQRVMMGGLALKAGEERSFVMTFTAMPPSEAEVIFAKSQLMPCVKNEKRLVIPFDPTGTKFDKTTAWQDPSTATMAWSGGTLDTRHRTRR